MGDIIEWCNENNGFLTFILSLLSLFVAMIAILVSVNTSRLPFKKRFKLGHYIAMPIISNKIITYTSNASLINLSQQVVNYSFIGFGYYEGKQLKKIYVDNNGPFLHKPQECKEIVHSYDIIQQLGTKIPNKRLYIVGIDIEGKIYRKRFWTTSDLASVFRNANDNNH